MCQPIPNGRLALKRNSRDHSAFVQGKFEEGWRKGLTEINKTTRLKLTEFK